MKRSRSPPTDVPHHNKECCVLHIRNMPPNWPGLKMKKFIIDSCKSQKTAEGLRYVINLPEKNGLHACLAKFKSGYLCNLALSELNGLECGGRKLDINLDTENLFYKSYQLFKMTSTFRGQKPGGAPKPHMGFGGGPNQTDNINYNSPGPSQNMQQSNEQPDENLEQSETYGLSKAFLASLNIGVPILRKIFVGNLDARVDEAKLRELFSYAGQVMQIILISHVKEKPLAKIEFDHPVEAVQAISMFHNQELYGKPMHVQMDLSRHKHRNIPKGLAKFGPGLGPKGEPLRGVRMHVELMPIKNLFMQEVNKLKEKSETEQQVAQVNPVQMDPNMVVPMGQNPMSMMTPFIQPNQLMSFTSLMNNQNLQNMQLFQNLMQQSNGDNTAFMSQLASMQGNMAGNTAMNTNSSTSWTMTNTSVNKPLEQFPTSRADTDYNYQDDTNSYEHIRKNFGEKEIRKHSFPDDDIVADSTKSNSDLLVFNNLPSSVSVQALTSKMREVGDVKFVEMTGQGRALVRFCHPRDADRCVKLFHESKVDGKTIGVRMF